MYDNTVPTCLHILYIFIVIVTMYFFMFIYFCYFFYFLLGNCLLYLQIKCINLTFVFQLLLQAEKHKRYIIIIIIIQLEEVDYV